MLRRSAYLLCLPLLALAGWLAAPALSLDPYLPEAENFGHALPGLERVGAAGPAARHSADDGHDHLGEGPVSHRSGVIDAPKRFDLVGLAGELRPYELRARAAGGEWSEWVETGNGDPAHFGESDQVQIRTRGWRPSGRLAYVNVSGTTSAGDRLLNEARGAVNGALITVASVVLPGAEAAAPKPDFIGRRQWGANRSEGGCPPRKDPTYGLNTRAGVVHHTVNSNSYTRAQAPGIVLGICRFHRFENNWDDIGYNVVVDRFGRLFTGRAGGVGKPVVGAHAQGFNRQTSGAAVLGTHSNVEIPSAARRAFGRFFAWRLRNGKPIKDRVQMTSLGGPQNKHPQGKKIRTQRVIPHRRLGLTACPGDAGMKGMAQIRNIAHRIRTEHE